MRLCSIPGCGAEFVARGWCQRHYYLWQRTGSPEGALVQCRGCDATWRRTTAGRGFKLCTDCRQTKAVCCQCDRVLPREQLGSRVRCKPCDAVHRKARYRPSGYKKTAEQARRSNLRQKYGISLEEYEAQFEAQRGRCAICQRDDQKLVVDHCHRQGHVRSLLCGGCNKGLGMFGEDPERLAAAIQYLTTHGGA